MNLDHLTNDPAGRHLLDNYPNAYGAHGFVYLELETVTIAAGGDAAITVGIYASDEHLHEGDPITLQEWDTITPDTIAAAIEMIEQHTNA